MMIKIRQLTLGSVVSLSMGRPQLERKLNKLIVEAREKNMYLWVRVEIDDRYNLTLKGHAVTPQVMKNVPIGDIDAFFQNERVWDDRPLEALS